MWTMTVIRALSVRIDGLMQGRINKGPWAGPSYGARSTNKKIFYWCKLQMTNEWFYASEGMSWSMAGLFVPGQWLQNIYYNFMIFEYFSIAYIQRNPKVFIKLMSAYEFCSAMSAKHTFIKKLKTQIKLMPSFSSLTQNAPQQTASHDCSSDDYCLLALCGANFLCTQLLLPVVTVMNDLKQILSSDFCWPIFSSELLTPCK